MNIVARLKQLKQAVEEKVWPVIFKEKFGKPGDDFRNGDEAFYTLRKLNICNDIIVEKMVAAPGLFIPRQNIIMAFFCGKSREWVKQENAPDKLVEHDYPLPTQEEREAAMEALWPTLEQSLQAIMDKYETGVQPNFWAYQNMTDAERRADEERFNDARRATDLMHCAVSIIAGGAPPESLLESFDDLRGWLEPGFQSLPNHLLNRFPKQEGGQLVSGGRLVQRQDAPQNNGSGRQLRVEHGNGRQLRVENGNGNGRRKEKPKPQPVEEKPAEPLPSIAGQMAGVAEKLSFSGRTKAMDTTHEQVTSLVQ